MCCRRSMTNWLLGVCFVITIHTTDSTSASSAIAQIPNADSADAIENDEKLLRMRVVIDHSISSRKEARYVEHTFIWPAVGYWNKTLEVLRRSSAPIRKGRDCVGSKVPVFDNATLRYSEYCFNSCASTTMCGRYEVPTRYLAPCHRCKNGICSVDADYVDADSAVYADFLLFVHSYSDSNCSTGVRGASTICQLDPVSDRPVIATISVCRNVLSAESSFDEASIVQLFKHEMAHVLGFAESVYPFYRDRLGNPLVQRDQYGEPLKNRPNLLDKIVRRTTREWQSAVGVFQRKVALIVLPTVVREVRAHFACDSLEGAELESSGGDEAGSHWEKRIFSNELMGNTFSEYSYTSRITLALLQDTGWYNVRMSRAENFDWGAGLGCEFATKSCYSYMQAMRKKGLSAAPFCDSLSSVADEHFFTCDAARSRLVHCNLRRYPRGDIPPMFQYFNTSFTNMPNGDRPEQYGGLASADYCPYLQQRARKRTSVPGRLRFVRCGDSSLQLAAELNNASESFGLDSMCLRQATPFSRTYHGTGKTVSNRQWGSGCYRVICTSSKVIIEINSNVQLQCYYEQETKYFEDKSANYTTRGSLICPSCADVCHSVAPCPMMSATVANRSANLANDTIFTCKNSSERCRTKYSLKSLGKETYNKTEQPVASPLFSNASSMFRMSCLSLLFIACAILLQVRSSSMYCRF